MERYYVALSRYVPKPYEGAVLLVKARTQPLYHLIEPEKAWPTITKDLDVHVMPCTHLSIVREPHVRDVAALIKSKVAAIASRYASSAAVAGRAGGRFRRACRDARGEFMSDSASIGAGAPLRCVLIGGESLLIQCADILLRQGHRVAARRVVGPGDRGLGGVAWHPHAPVRRVARGRARTRSRTSRSTICSASPICG